MTTDGRFCRVQIRTKKEGSAGGRLGHALQPAAGARRGSQGKSAADGAGGHGVSNSVLLSGPPQSVPEPRR